MNTILFSFLTLVINCKGLELEYFNPKPELDITNFNLTSTTSTCLLPTDMHNLCLDSLSSIQENQNLLQGSGSGFNCLLSDIELKVSMSDECSKHHCTDGSDLAFCYLKSRFWKLGDVPDFVGSSSEAYVKLDFLEMPVQIQQWLDNTNSSLEFTVQIYNTISSRLTNMSHSSPRFRYPVPANASSATVTLPGPVLNFTLAIPSHSIGYAISVALFVSHKNNKNKKNASPPFVVAEVSPSLTRRFALAFRPPMLVISPELVVKSLNAFLDKTSERSVVRVQAVVDTLKGVAPPLRVHWRCQSLVGSQLASVTPTLAPLSLIDESVDFSLASAKQKNTTSSSCLFWLSLGNNNAATAAISVSRGGPKFAVALDLVRGVNATLDGGLQVEWRVPAAWSDAYPPSAYNFTIDYWPDNLCGRGIARLVKIRNTAARLSRAMLNPASRYWLSVRACDPDGCGPWSNFAQGLTVGPPVPSVDLVSAQLYNGTDLLVAWRVGPVDPSWHSGKAWKVSLYYSTSLFHVLCSAHMADDAEVATSISSRVLLDQLEGCSIYSMRSQVTDLAGYGPASPIYLQATGLSPTSPPKNVQYIYPYHGNATQALVFWNSPCIFAFKSLAYVLRVTDLFTQETREFFVDATADSVVTQLVDELDLGRPYRLMVLANVLGGKSSVPVVLQTDAFTGFTGLLSAIVDGGDSASIESGATHGDLLVQWTPDHFIARLLQQQQEQHVKGGDMANILIELEVFVRKASSSLNSTRSFSSSYSSVFHSATSEGAAAASPVAWHRLVTSPAAAASASASCCSLRIHQLLSPVSPLARCQIQARLSLRLGQKGLRISGYLSPPVPVVLGSDTSVVNGDKIDASTAVRSKRPPAFPLAVVVSASAVTVAGVVALAILLVFLAPSGWARLQRWRQRRAWLRQHRLLIHNAYDDASGTLFPENAAVAVSAK